MPHPNGSLSGRPSDSWDTNYARKFLLIPKDELTVFDISEKSTPQQTISQKPSSEDKFSDQITEELSIPRVEKSDKAYQLFTASETSNITIAVAHTSNLLQKERSEVPLITEKYSNSDSISLHKSETIEVTSVIPKQKLSSSAPGVPILESTSFNMSTEHHTFSKSDKLQQLNATYVVPSVLDDKTNNIQAFSDEPCKIITKKISFEKLGTQIPNESNLEEPVSPIVPKFGGLPVFPNNSVDRKNFLSKKLKLLEKRFSPSKEFGLVSSYEENLKPKRRLKNDGIQKMTTPFTDDILVSKESVSSPNEIYDKEINSSKAASQIIDERAASTFPHITKSPEKATLMQKELLGEIHSSNKKYSKEIPLKSNTSVFEEESFISQPFPCGQPPSNSQFFAKSCVANRPETQSPIESQGAVSTTKENLVEKANTSPDDFYEKCNDQVEVNALKDRAGGKRKRKSKGDKQSKKFHIKSFACIQYTDKQVQDMIEIIRHFELKKNCI